MNFLHRQIRRLLLTVMLVTSFSEFDILSTLKCGIISSECYLNTDSSKSNVNKFRNNNKNKNWTDNALVRRFAIPPGARFFAEPMIRVPIVDNDTEAFHYTAVVAIPITLFFDRLGWPVREPFNPSKFKRPNPNAAPAPESPESPELQETEDEIIDYESPTSSNFAFSGDAEDINAKTKRIHSKIINDKDFILNELDSFNQRNIWYNSRSRHPRQADQDLHSKDRNKIEESSDFDDDYDDDEDSEAQDDDDDDDDVDKIKSTTEDGDFNVRIHKIIRRSPNKKLPAHNSGGERAELIPALEKIIKSLGFKGEECLLRAVCEIHEYPLETGYGLIGEFITMLFSVSRSKYAESHLPKYLQAELDGKNQDCSPYAKHCKNSIFQWHAK